MSQFAEFHCTDCEHEFAEHLPPLAEDLPRCPICGSDSKLYALLEAQRHRWAQMSIGLALTALDLGTQFWPF